MATVLAIVIVTSNYGGPVEIGLPVHKHKTGDKIILETGQHKPNVHLEIAHVELLSQQDMYI